MKKTNLKKIGLLLIFCCCIKPAIGQNVSIPQNSQTPKAIALIEKAKSLIYKDIDAKSIKSIALETSSTNDKKLKNGEIKRNTRESKLFITFPNQIRIEEYTDYSTNQHLSTEILNFPRVSITSDVLVNGQPFAFGNNLSGIIPKLTKEQRIDLIKTKVFNIIFPLLLQSYWNDDLKFNYIGEAVSKDFKADIVEVIHKDGDKFQLLFDKTSNLPIMMLQKFINPITKTETERKTYYLDYKKINGILVAHKIIVQTGDTETEERQLKKIELNPTFKPNLFEIKEDKINPY
jgi:hypothetical protein